MTSSSHSPAFTGFFLPIHSANDHGVRSNGRSFALKPTTRTQTYVPKRGLQYVRMQKRSVAGTSCASSDADQSGLVPCRPSVCGLQTPNRELPQERHFRLRRTSKSVRMDASRVSRENSPVNHALGPGGCDISALKRQRSLSWGV